MRESVLDDLENEEAENVKRVKRIRQFKDAIWIVLILVNSTLVLSFFIPFNWIIWMVWVFVYALITVIGYGVLIGVLMIVIGFTALLFHLLGLKSLVEKAAWCIEKINFIQDDAAPTAWNPFVIPQAFIFILLTSITNI